MLSREARLAVHVTEHALQRWRQRAAVNGSTAEDLRRTLVESEFVVCLRGTSYYQYTAADLLFVVVESPAENHVITVLVGLHAKATLQTVYRPHKLGRNRSNTTLRQRQSRRSRYQRERERFDE